VATGVQFAPITAEALRVALDDLCDLYTDKAQWQKLQRNAMKQPVGWDRSAASYAALYAEVLGR